MSRSIKIGDVVVVTGHVKNGMNITENYLIEDINMWNGGYQLTIIDQK